MKRHVLATLAVAALALTTGACVRYNTYYLAKKYYDLGTDGKEYVVTPITGGAQGTSTASGFNPQNAAGGGGNFVKSIDYAKKVIALYPKSSLVDDSYLMWARALLGNNDPLQTIGMLQDFSDRYPKSDRRADATFYLGLAYRQARKYRESVQTFDDFLKNAPKHHLVAYAYLERARALVSLDRDSEAAVAAGEALKRSSKKTPIGTQAQLVRADALYASGDYDAAREDFRALGRRARDDEERLTLLFREADCLEASRHFDDELTLLRGVLSHEKEPDPPPTSPNGTPLPQTGVVNDRYGRIQVRVGTAHALAGRIPEALEAYRRVVRDYGRSPIAAEAQYRVGYVFETVGDDFDKARDEYGKVKDIAQSAFATQAAQRLGNLDRLAQFKKAGGDSTEKRAEAGFLAAELYLFQLDKPERALEEYRKVASDFPGTAWQAKALTAQAWVLNHRFQRRADADSLLWRVVREHPATESQLAARDYLEQEGIDVPPELIKEPPKPAPKPVAVDTTLKLTPPPATTPQLGVPAGADSLHRAIGPAGPNRAMFNAPPGPAGAVTPPRPSGSTNVAPPASSPPDTTLRHVSGADSTGRPPK